MPQSSDDGKAEAIYLELRRTAASDPRAARARLLEMLSADSSILDRLFDLMKPPSESRLRHLVANTAKSQRGDKQIRDRLIPHLLQWQRFESDEFAKSAISAALQGLDLAAYANTYPGSAAPRMSDSASEDLLCSEEAVEIYRWVAGRLCHRVRNRMELPIAYLVDAIHEATAIEDDATRTAVTKRLIEAQQTFKEVARIVEFNIDDDHFRWRPVAIVPWLKKMTDSYKASNRFFQLEIAGDRAGSDQLVEATDLLLEVIFWNLWQNIAQEADGECVAKVGISACDGRLYFLISDNGPGFQPTHTAEAFKTSLSTRGEERGRGLLEVADAVQRLRGTARLVPVSGEYRIELSFPIAKTSRELS
jgi:signal transduction histidine kinase